MHQIREFWNRGWVGKVVIIGGSAAALVVACCVALVGLVAIVPSSRQQPIAVIATTVPIQAATAALEPTSAPTAPPTNTPAPTSTPLPTAVIRPTTTRTPKPRATAVPSSFHLGSDSDDIPASYVLSVGGSLSTQINGASVDITLDDFRQVRLTQLPNERVFETTFTIVSTSDSPLNFLSSDVFMGMNNSGFRYSRGASATLTKAENINVNAHSTDRIVLEWRTKAFNVDRDGRSPQVVWITIGNPISENGNVEGYSNMRVFRLNFE